MLCNFLNLEKLLEHQIFRILTLFLLRKDNTNVIQVGSDLRKSIFLTNFKREKRLFVNLKFWNYITLSKKRISFRLNESTCVFLKIFFQIDVIGQLPIPRGNLPSRARVKINTRSSSLHRCTFIYSFFPDQE